MRESTPMKPGGRYRVADHVATRHLGGSTLVTVGDGSHCFELDPIGSALWQTMSLGADLDELVRQLAASFDVDERAARADVEAFLGNLVEHGLVEPVPI